MNKILPLFFVLCSLASFGQRYTIIDKNESTQALFDYESPLSLVSLISSNYFHDWKGINPNAEKRLIKNGFQDDLNYYESYDPDPYPLTDNDPESPTFGEPLIEELPDGTLQFVYPPPERTYYDVSDITRIIIVEDSVLDPITYVSYFGIKEIAFAKKYGTDNKYDVCLTINYKELMLMDAFKVILKTPESTNSEIINPDDNYSLLSAIKKDCLTAFMADSIENSDGDYEYQHTLPENIHFLINDQSFYAPRWRGSEYSKINPDKYGEQKIAWNHVLENTLFEDFYFGNSWSEGIPDFFESRMITNTYLDASSPLIDEDPNSSHFGEPLVQYNDNGTMEFLYPYYKDIYWIQPEKIETYIVYDFKSEIDPFTSYEGHGIHKNYAKPPEIEMEKVLFATEVPGYDKPVVFVSVLLEVPDDKMYAADEYKSYTYNAPTLDTPEFFHDYSSLPWRIQLNKAFDSNASLNPSNKKDLKKIVSEFNLDDDQGSGTNIFGIHVYKKKNGKISYNY